MTIPPGRRLGTYEIVAQIGAGGMGEVYRAHDTKLARDVAIKVLPANFVNARFSPDGRWLAYTSDESGRYEIYVQPYPGPGGKWQISTEGGKEPAWNQNGRELFYRNGDKMMAVDIATQPGFTAGTPRMLFEGRYEVGPVPSVNYDVTTDGQRFLMLKPSETQETALTQINVVLNWTKELKRRVPAGTK